MRTTLLRLAATLLALTATAGAHAQSTIDVLVVYTTGLEKQLGGNVMPQVNQMIEAANLAYADSGVPATLRIAGTQKVAYSDDGSSDTALNAVTRGSGLFTATKAARDAVGADMVVLYRLFKPSHGSCGVAWVNSGPGGDKGNLSAAGKRDMMYAHVSVGGGCPVIVTAHELGHNMGLTHSRRQDSTGATFPFATGYGVDGLFTDIMAYPQNFGVAQNRQVYKFSSPDLVCAGQPCGVDRTAANGADAAYALSQVVSQIAGYATYSSSPYASVTSRIATLEAAKNSATAARVAKQTQVDAQNALVKAQTTKTDAAQKALKTAVDNYNKLVTTQNSQAAKGNSLIAQITTTQTALRAATTQATITSLTSKLTTLQSQLATVNAQITKTNADLTTGLANVNALTPGAQAEAAKLAPLVATLNALKTELTTLTTAEKAAIASWTAAKAEYEALKKVFG